MSFLKVFRWQNVNPEKQTGRTTLSLGLCLLLLLFAGRQVVRASDNPTESQIGSLPLKNSHYRFTYDQLSLPGNETMGLFGGYLLWEPTESSYIGLGIFSALEGKRGGFFVGGVETGWRPLVLGKNLYFDAGLFIGAGGGGGAPQGGGLMLRPHLGLVYNLENYRLGLQRSSVLFPDGDISSNQWVLSIEIPFQTVRLAGWPSVGKNTAIHKSTLWNQHGRDKVILVKLHSLSPNGSKKVSGADLKNNLALMGIELQSHFSDHGYTLFAVDGAWGGGIDGYAQVQLGVGYQLPLSQKNSLLASLSLGGAGGGAVNTGGGVTLELEMAYRQFFSKHWGWQLGVGYLSAPDGEFEASMVSLSTVYRYRSLNMDSSELGSARLAAAEAHKWRVQGVLQSYYPVGNTQRKNGISDDQRIDLFGLSVETPFSRSCLINGQALGAYHGQAGGFAVGLIGIACEAPALGSPSLHARAEISLGVAGGGGLAVGDGLLGQVMLGLNYAINDRWNMLMSLGYAQAPSGTFEAYVSNLALGYRFSTLQSN